jgi:hypothetical protein
LLFELLAPFLEPELGLDLDLDELLRFERLADCLFLELDFFLVAISVLR